MLDINLIRNQAEYVKNSLLKKGFTVDFKELLEQDKEKRELLTKVEALKAQKNKVNALVPAYKKEGKDVSVIFDQVKQMNTDIEMLDQQIEKLTDRMNEFLYGLPNMPDEDLKDGGKENNEVVYTFGKKPEFSFKPKSHTELTESLGLIDYERAAKISGSGSWIYSGMGARLEWALINFFIDEHVKDGYQFMLLPHMLNYECGFGAAQFPKFMEEVYWIDGMGKNNKFLLPTAETALVNYYRNEILKAEDLPKKFIGFTPCYRREAGSYRAEERGMIRGHQFHKVEMVHYTTKEKSDASFEELVKKAERLVEKLGLHFHTSKLAAGDCSSAMARTYDIEMWIPSMNIYKEVSSVSNGRDYQSRRGNIRYRDENGKLEYAHLLNGSGLATPRVFPAILEQFQNEDGSVTIPQVLRPYLGGLEKLEPVTKG